MKPTRIAALLGSPILAVFSATLSATQASPVTVNLACSDTAPDGPLPPKPFLRDLATGYLLQWTQDEHMPSLPADSLGRKIVMLPNWNEFGEGHFLMPSTLTGFSYVDAMREVFAGGGAHEDVKPSLLKNP